MTYAEGLKPMAFFDSQEEMLSLGGESLLRDLVSANKKLRASLNSVVPFIHEDGTCKSLNGHVQPVIATIYGPTGSGKSQLLRNIISNQLISPPPETVFFVVPDVELIPPQEMSAWFTQVCEGNYRPGPEHTIVPTSGTLMPQIKIMSYDDLTQDHNFDVAHPQNVFAKAASKGPICIVIDECMENLGRHKGIAKFFHALPSKLHDRFPRCTGYSVFVVLHNMNPRKDLGGNIANLKIQSKLHIMSPRMSPAQLNRFINTYTKSLPPPIALLLKDIFHHHAQHGRYDWIIYNTCPDNDALQWMYLSPQEGLIPMYLNDQTFLYSVLDKISKILKTRQRWRRAYRYKRMRAELSELVRDQTEEQQPQPPPLEHSVPEQPSPPPPTTQEQPLTQ